MGDYKILKYTEDYKELWDNFVIHKSINGTFLHTRNFLNYHKERFVDTSYLFMDRKERIVAVCPACTIYENEKKILCSHKGSTFGGILFGEKSYNTLIVIEILKLLETHLIECKYDEINIKLTSDLFSTKSSDLMQYCLYYCGYSAFNELNMYINLKEYEQLGTTMFSHGKRESIKKCIKKNIVVKELKDDKEVHVWYNILCETLGKYSLVPIHTLDELLEFKNYRLKEECVFFGAFLEDKMVAGAMLFLFNKVAVAHTQYLCALAEYNSLSPMSYTYYQMINISMERGFKNLSWGITSEHLGYELNLGLTKSKEAFGSKYSINRIYKKKW